MNTKSKFKNFPSIGGLMVSKMVVNENIKPGFLYREKRVNPQDSGWRIFTGLEDDDYINNPSNAGIYDPSTILEIDPSLEHILLQGFGSVYERTEENPDWYRVYDFDLDDDYFVTHKLTEDWTIKINNLFERTIEETGDLFYTTGDKSVRLTIWVDEEKTAAEVFHEYKVYAEKRDQSELKTLKIFDLSDENVLRTGYMINESDERRSYKVIYAHSIIEGETVFSAIYFDNDEDIEWALETWKNITLKEDA